MEGCRDATAIALYYDRLMSLLQGSVVALLSEQLAGGIEATSHGARATRTRGLNNRSDPDHDGLRDLDRTASDPEVNRTDSLCVATGRLWVL